MRVMFHLQMMHTPLILGCVGLGFYSMTLIACAVMLVAILTRVQSLKSNIFMLLMGNTYLALLFFSTSMLIMYGHNQHGNLHPSLWLGGRWCRIRTFVAHVALGGVYYSFVLQAIFRLFRIVFYERKVLCSFHAFVLAVSVQWSLAVACVLPNLLLDDFQYLPAEFNCWIAFENIRGLLVLIVAIYGIPTTTISFIYLCIIRYVQRSNPMQHQSRVTVNVRDVTILRRLLILVAIVVVFGLPTVLVIFIYVCAGFVMPLAYHIQGVSLSTGAFVTAIAVAFVTPQLRQLFKAKHKRTLSSRSYNEFAQRSPSRRLCVHANINADPLRAQKD